MKIIIHIDEHQKWPMVLNNLTHLEEHYHDSEDLIEVLVNGEAVADLTSNSDQFQNIKDYFFKNKSKLFVCSNSLKQREISENEIPDLAYVVKSGVVELIEKQNQGYFYLRP